MIRINRNDLRKLGIIYQFLWKKAELNYRILLILTLISVTLASFGVIYAPYLFSKILDLTNSISLHYWQIVISVLAYCMLYWISNSLYQAVWILFGPLQERVQKKANLYLLQHLMQLPYQFHIEEMIGKLNETFSQAQNGLNRINFHLLTGFIPILLQFLFVIIFTSLFFDLKYVTIIILTIILYLLAMSYGTEYTRKFLRDSQQAMLLARGQASDAILNFETVKIFNGETLVLNKYKKRLDDAENSFSLFNKGRFLLGFSQSTIIALGLTISIFLALNELFLGKITTGQLVLIKLYLIQIIRRLEQLNLSFQEIKLGLTFLDSFLWIMDRKPFLEFQEKMPELVNVKGHLKFDRVYFQYNKEHFKIEDISFELVPGETLVIVGSTGAGKSTIAKLLLRFYNVDAGAILIDNANINEVKHSSLLNQIALVPQESILFNDTIYNNIIFANPEATIEEVENASQLSQVDKIVQKYQDGFETLVGERGMKLSGGERQRIGHSRAILKKPKIFLFDEATSALDKKTEKEILEDIKRVCLGTTTIMITHRLSSICKESRIMVMDKGMIAEYGIHDALISLNGIYTELWNSQSWD